MDKRTAVHLRFDAFDLDEANARLSRNGKPIGLPPRAFAVLCELARQPGQLITKNGLLDAVWGHQHVSESLLKSVISEVRAALGDDARKPRFVETASRFGYRFIAPLATTPVLVASTPAHEERSRSGPHLVGRTAALDKISSLWQRTLAGERQLLFVAGEAGVGKTTLIESFVSGLAPRIAAYGRCIEHYGTGEPYLPVLEVLREICRLEPELPALMRTIAPTWLIQMPWLVNESERAALHRELAGAHPDRMVREMRELMDHFTALRPIVFILEDMHWSDLGTLRMMEHFARRPRPVPILWIATFRLTQIIADNHPLKELRTELRLHKLCEEILLDPFSESEVGAYLAHRLPERNFPEVFVRRLHAHTDGLPLFVANVTDTLIAQADADPTTMQRWLQAASDAPLPVPDNLAGVIEKQAGRLPAEEQALLQAAAVCGVEFRAGTVADLLTRDIEWVRERCDDLVRRQLWLRHVGITELPDGGFDTRYAFLHALYPHVLYDRLALSQRVQYHRRAARSLDRHRAVGESPAPAELASHYERGHESLAALKAYGDAAALALAHFAPRDAEFLAAHALSLLNRCPESDEKDAAELMLAAHAGVAASQLQGVASAPARSSFERVRVICDRLPQTPERALMLNGLGWDYYVRGEFDDAIALAHRLELLSVEHDDIVLATLASNLSGLALINQGKLVQGCEVFERGIERCLPFSRATARADFVIDPEVSMRLNLAPPLADLGRVDCARRHFRLGYERAHLIKQPMCVMLAYWAGGMLEARLGNPEGVGEHAARLGEFVERIMISQAKGPSLWLRGLAEAHRGAHVGHRHILEGYECHARLGMFAGCSEVLGYATEALVLTAEWDAAQRQLDAALALAERIGERLCLPTLHLLQARIALGRDDPAAARRAIEAALLESSAQTALGQQLKALVALNELPDASPADRAALRTVHGKLRLDIPVYHRATALLQAPS